jgi:cysteamine dioxygenase
MCCHYSELHIRSFDWVNDEGVDESTPGTLRLARVVADHTLEAPVSLPTIYPSRGGNLHCCTAVNASAMLEVISPPYAPGGGRDARYFEEVASGSKSETLCAGEVWLVEIECPENFHMTWGAYSGIKFGSENDSQRPS